LVYIIVTSATVYFIPAEPHCVHLMAIIRLAELLCENYKRLWGTETEFTVNTGQMALHIACRSIKI